MDFDKYNIHTMEYPTYLKEIFKKSEEITLVYSKVNPNGEDEIENEEVPNLKEDITETSLELTGNPLEVDLKGSNDLCDTSTLDTPPDVWTQDEAKHYPIGKVAGRKLLNTLNKNYSYNIFGKGESKVSPTFFVLLDPKDDDRNTFLLGSNVQSNKRIISYIKKCNSKTHPDMDPYKMVEKHKKHCSLPNQETCVSTAVYCIQGWNFENHRENSTYSSIHLEIKYNGYCYEPPLDKIITKQLKMQIMNDHMDSPFHHFWQQLVFVRIYMDAYMSGNVSDDWVFSANPMHISEICNSIKELMQPCKVMRQKDSNFKDLDLNNRKDEEFMDKLWGLLIRSESIADLKECITIIFEEFASPHFFLPNKISNTTSIGAIIKGISSGTMAVPNITASQALLYLIELGVQKLKNDYLYIIDHCHKGECVNVTKHWNDISKIAVEEANKEDLRKTGVNPRMTVVSRLTRITKGKDTVNQDLTGITTQINYLANLHVMSQFMYLALSVLPQEINEFLIDSIAKKYSSGPLRLKQLEVDGFQEIVVDLDRISFGFLEKQNMISWNLNITSKMKDSQVTSIYHLSDRPIIPPCIFKGYNINTEDSKEKIYHVIETIVLSAKC